MFIRRRNERLIYMYKIKKITRFFGILGSMIKGLIQIGVIRLLDNTDQYRNIDQTLDVNPSESQSTNSNKNKIFANSSSQKLENHPKKMFALMLERFQKFKKFIQKFVFYCLYFIFKIRRNYPKHVSLCC